MTKNEVMAMNELALRPRSGSACSYEFTPGRMVLAEEPQIWFHVKQDLKRRRHRRPERCDRGWRECGEKASDLLSTVERPRPDRGPRRLNCAHEPSSSTNCTIASPTSRLRQISVSASQPIPVPSLSFTASALAPSPIHRPPGQLPERELRRAIRGQESLPSKAGKLLCHARQVRVLGVCSLHRDRFELEACIPNHETGIFGQR